MVRVRGGEVVRGVVERVGAGTGGVGVEEDVGGGEVGGGG